MQAAKSSAVWLAVTLTLRDRGRRTDWRFRSACTRKRSARPGRDRCPHLANELDRALVEADHWAVWIRRFGIEHMLHAGDVFFGVDLRNAPHVLAPGLQIVFAQAPTDGFARDAGMFGGADQFTGQEFERRARPPGGWLAWPQ